MKAFDYTVESSRGFNETVAAIEEKSAAKGFKVLAVRDVKATLESKGIVREPMKIIEICNAKYVNEVLAKDIKIALMLPCPIVVYAQDGKILVSALRPRVIADFYPSTDVCRPRGRGGPYRAFPSRRSQAIEAAARVRQQHSSLSVPAPIIATRTSEARFDLYRFLRYHPRIPWSPCMFPQPLRQDRKAG